MMKRMLLAVTIVVASGWMALGSPQTAQAVCPSRGYYGGYGGGYGFGYGVHYRAYSPYVYRSYYRPHYHRHMYGYPYARRGGVYFSIGF